MDGAGSSLRPTPSLPSLHLPFSFSFPFPSLPILPQTYLLKITAHLPHGPTSLPLLNLDEVHGCSIVLLLRDNFKGSQERQALFNLTAFTFRRAKSKVEVADKSFVELCNTRQYTIIAVHDLKACNEEVNNA